MVLFLIPVIGLDNAAKGVIAIDEDNNKWVIPGVSFVNRGFTAFKSLTLEYNKGEFFYFIFYTSGVTSLGEKPVPPVMMIKFNSDQEVIVF